MDVYTEKTVRYPVMHWGSYKSDRVNSEALSVLGNVIRAAEGVAEKCPQLSDKIHVHNTFITQTGKWLLYIRNRPTVI